MSTEPITISVILPAYNEAERLPPYLESVRAYLERHYADHYEVIVVDDGSQDGMSDRLELLAAEWGEFSLICHGENRGKGAAVRTGMLAARGQLLLFTDADGATPIDELSKLSEALHADADVAVGSRLMVDHRVNRRRTWTRGLAGRLFARLARWWLKISIRDTQCGFKMFRREAGRKLFSASEESGYLFDLELLLLANRFGFQVTEVPVNWSDIPGGHLRLTHELFRVFVALWRLRRRYAKHA